MLRVGRARTPGTNGTESKIMLRTIREFWNDQRGIAMILVAIMLPVLVGFALLAIDMSRANSLHNDLQKGADAMALAAAAELDGRSDSITRANQAVTNLLTNQTKFSTAGDHTLALADVTVTYLTGIPASDNIALGADGVDANGVNWASTDPKAVAFAEVTVNPSGVADGAGAFATIFPASFLGGNDTMDIQPQAVAGFTQTICETVPIFMCNPFETDTPLTSKTIQQAFASGDTYSREFRVLKTDNNSRPGPGNFGLLDNDLQSLRDAIAMGTAGTCYNRNALTTKTGVTLGQVNTGLNVRFDIYSGKIKQHDSEWAYRPASNVRKGDKGGNCNKYTPDDPTKSMPLPPGNNYNKGMTDSTWDRSTYWSVNHKATYPSIPSKSNPTGNMGAPASRYDVYKYEIENGLVPDKSKGNETGVPQCFNKNKNPRPTADPDRRLLNLAIVDCLADGDKVINGHTKIKPDGYASVFLNAPIQKVDNTKNDDDDTANEKPISLEIVDVDGPLGDGTLDKAFRNEAQLYR
ncbi:TadE/TadG family type IV pilus assembly protein [Mesorhizobium sp. B2-8-5]|uniref:TadE/TadG family type IV pilus assembly protein n=1 Tax=Mesorhizobium sp. B2-8-5 TaxID=2589903 RepID=UPI0011298B4F|nr:pilus assembly protein TadG-related protein [Mesorhizobium sp. B2-8-5]UCI25787.1 pilus assembly protein TadG-related protein [Mesorhizobium sp. B2-8-5]